MSSELMVIQKISDNEYLQLKNFLKNFYYENIVLPNKKETWEYWETELDNSYRNTAPETEITTKNFGKTFPFGAAGNIKITFVFDINYIEQKSEKFINNIKRVSIDNFLLTKEFSETKVSYIEYFSTSISSKYETYENPIYIASFPLMFPTYFVVDGNHRLNARKNKEIPFIKAIILPNEIVCDSLYNEFLKTVYAFSCFLYSHL